ncbi:PAS domain-containing sensor histidine kinase [Verrucomicrobiaceae bacterium 227]
MNESGLKERQVDFEDFFENALCGHLIIHPDGRILRCNLRMAEWLGYEKEEIEGERFASLLTIGGRIFHETHLAPLLRMKGYFDEVALDLKDRSGGRLHVLVNACERRDKSDEPLCVRLTAYKATDRHIYEQNLRKAKQLAENQLLDAQETSQLREQFIAVLGHDLRNPLGAIGMGAAILEEAELKPGERQILGVMKESIDRMTELIEDVMDFARGRLGGEMTLKRENLNLQPILMHVIDELRVAHPNREIVADDVLTESVDCDPARISQILSNLVANALLHGAQERPITVRWSIHHGHFKLSVSNFGDPIPEEVLETIFQPFKRSKRESSDSGLGLGLYIASEVAKAHRGNLSVESREEETCFTLEFPSSTPEL